MTVLNSLTFVQTMNERAENCNQRMIAIDSFFFGTRACFNAESNSLLFFSAEKNKPFDVEDQRDLF